MNAKIIRCLIFGFVFDVAKITSVSILLPEEFMCGRFK
jgi:hypothetical protein